MVRGIKRVAPITFIAFLLLLAPLVAGFSITGGSSRFLLKSSPVSVRDMSLDLMALSSVQGKTTVNVIPKIVNLSYKLVSIQNPDGGWGYFPGSVSSVPYTAYAVVALQMAIRAVNNPKFDFTLYRSIMKGVSYLKVSRTGTVWGYIPGSSPMYYPTVMALWALGESGYGATSAVVSSAVPELSKLERNMYIPRPEGLALRVFALSSVGYPVSNATISEVRNLLFNGSLNVEERAMLTYALTLLEGTSFETVDALAILGHQVRKAGDYAFWVYSTDTPPATFDTVAPTAYALMAFSAFSPSIKPYPKAPCSALLALQNKDGGWGFKKGERSNAEATYYALTALKMCYPSNSTPIFKGLNWSRNEYAREYSKVKSKGRLLPGYFYSLETLLSFGLMNESQRKRAVTLIESLRLKSGVWGSNELGPQPFDTALALKALLDLGVSPDNSTVKNAVNWLLSISGSGWGVYYAKAKYPYMVDRNVLTTIRVLEALEGVANLSSLRPHLIWLLNQRVDDGWSYMKNYTVAVNNVTYVVEGKPRVDLTVWATLILRKFGYNYVNDTMSFILASLRNGSIYNDTLSLASAVDFMLALRKKPPVTLSDISDAIIRKGIHKVFWEGNVSTRLVNTLMSVLGGNVSRGYRITNPSQVSAPSIVLLPFKDAFVLGNPYFNLSPGRLSWASSSLRFNASHSILLIPGLLPGGPVLFIIYSNGRVLSKVLSAGYLRYMQGYAVLITFKDRNHDGTIELNEITAKVIG